jgi:hypothetical protein
MRHAEHKFPPFIERCGRSRRYYGGGDSAPANTTQTTQVRYSPEEQAMRDKVMRDASALYDQQKGQYTSMMYPGPRPVGASADTLAAQQRLREFSTGAGQKTADAAQGALQYGLHDVLDPNANPALQGTIDTATRKIGEAYTDPGGVISQIRSNFVNTAPGGQSSREGIAMGIAGRGYTNAIGDVTAKLTSDAYNKGQDTFAKTMAVAPNMYNLMTQPALTQAGVGQSEEAIRQQEEDYQANARMFGMNAPGQALQNFANMVYGGSNPTVQASGQGPGAPKMSPLAGMAAGATLGAAVGGPWGAAAGAVIGLAYTQF